MATPEISPGQDPKALAASALVALDKANTRLANGRAWYEDVRGQYLSGGGK